MTTRLQHWYMRVLAVLAFAAVRLAAANAPVLPGPFETFGGTRWTVADFDGDGRPDVLTARPDLAGSHFRHQIEIQLSSGTRRVVTFAVDGVQPGFAGIQVVARDVDGDHDVDLVFSTAVSHQPIGVWINDGAGGFAQTSDPALIAAAETLHSTASVSVPEAARSLAFQPRVPSPSPAPALRRYAPTLPASSHVRPWSIANAGGLLSGCLQSRAPPAVL